ncbi:MAG: MBL fold metallo-hydrolase [Desulfobulbaceae bacterium]|nr:MBL fold metallo-hydrolase [Desulfobulbaceae bacterium]
MEVHFLGVGEACDSRHGNTSALVTAGGCKILLDCGFSVPHRFFGICKDPDCLEYIWISHFHGDHFFGLPLLLLRFWEMGRTRRLQLIGQERLQEKTMTVLELAYPGFAKKLSFPLQFHSVQPGITLELEQLKFQTTPTTHSQANLGLLLDDGRKRLYYSGDGRPTAEVIRLAHGCDLALHEAFTWEDSIPNHGSVTGCLQLMEKAGIKQLALLHIERKTRQNRQKALVKLLKEHPDVLLPVENDIIHLD